MSETSTELDIWWSRAHSSAARAGSYPCGPRRSMTSSVSSCQFASTNTILVRSWHFSDLTRCRTGVRNACQRWTSIDHA